MLSFILNFYNRDHKTPQFFYKVKRKLNPIQELWGERINKARNIKSGIKIWVESSHTLTVGDVYWAAGESGETPFRKGCTGQTLSRTDYPELFNAIGTRYGEGDGSTTFIVPNIRDKFIEGGYWSDRGTVINAGLPNITGALKPPAQYSELAGGEWYANKIGQTGALKTTSHTVNYAISETPFTGGQIMASISFDASKSNAIYGKSTTVQPPAIKMYPVICTKSNVYVVYCFRRTA